MSFDYLLLSPLSDSSQVFAMQIMGVNSRRYFMNHGDSLPGSILLIVMCCATLLRLAPEGILLFLDAWVAHAVFGGLVQL